MRTILLAALLCPLLCVSTGASAQSDVAPSPPSTPFSPSTPSEPDASPEAFDEETPSQPEKPDATEAPPNPNAVTVRRPAILHWWDAPTFDRRVNLVVKDADLNTAIDALGRAAGMNLIAAGGSKARKKVTLNLRGAPLRDVMLAMANLYGLTWFRSGEVYTLTYVSASTKRTGTAAPALPRPRRPVIVVPERSTGTNRAGTTMDRTRPTTDVPRKRMNTRDPDLVTPGP